MLELMKGNDVDIYITFAVSYTIVIGREFVERFASKSISEIRSDLLNRSERLHINGLYGDRYGSSALTPPLPLPPLPFRSRGSCSEVRNPYFEVLPDPVSSHTFRISWYCEAKEDWYPVPNRFRKYHTFLWCDYMGVTYLVAPKVWQTPDTSFYCDPLGVQQPKPFMILSMEVRVGESEFPF